MSPYGESTRSRSRDVGGFTLVEALVAFVVLAVFMSVISRFVVGLGTGALASDSRKQADLVAKAIFEDALTKRDLGNGTTSGIRDGRHWTLKTSALDLSAQLPRPDPGNVRESGNTQGTSQTTGATPQGGPSSAESNAAASAGTPPAPGATATAEPQKPAWTFQRLIVDVETGGRPVEIETIRLVKAPQ